MLKLLSRAATCLVYGKVCPFDESDGLKGLNLFLLGSPMSHEYAWKNREGRLARYEGKRVGGTVAVHFIKKNMWYLETALALLEGDDHSEAEKYEWNRHLEMEMERQQSLQVREGSTDAEDQDDTDVAAATALRRQMESEAEEVACQHKAQKKTMQREI